MKQFTNDERKKQRKQNFEQAKLHFENEEFELAGKRLSEAVTISPYLKYSIIKALRENNYEYIVAPYEADS